MSVSICINNLCVPNQDQNIYQCQLYSVILRRARRGLRHDGVRKNAEEYGINKGVGSCDVERKAWRDVMILRNAWRDVMVNVRAWRGVMVQGRA